MFLRAKDIDRVSSEIDEEIANDGAPLTGGQSVSESQFEIATGLEAVFGQDGMGGLPQQCPKKYRRRSRDDIEKTEQ